ncbi:DUF58 domain-containing protein [Bacillaceae bacterium SIJ1]|uniref:DUF58 domain-containing protein n=1 Tax=Litoribacterium kuwaitense TaxID=1398745 RepID=UPI0013EBAD3A|nr:DUF58 domain-containing protein [Litoribacterium kuwaitense]NGP44272.1 DUF58 domain-containing protein [Litoribacterium kuwaitense]
MRDQSKTLISAAFQKKLRRKVIQPNAVKTGFHSGKRKSRSAGQSLDFADFREYHPGDDVRQMDWNVYARTNKHYIKQFLDQRELSVVLYLDASLSMAHDAEKWLRLKQIAGALGCVSLLGEDRFSLIPVGSSTRPWLLKKGGGHAANLLSYLEGVESSQQTFAEGLAKTTLPKTSLSIVCSDFLEPVEPMLHALRKLHHRSDVWLLQLLSSSEVTPAYDGDVRLIDVETSNDVQVSMHERIIRKYEQKLKDHSGTLQQFALQRGMGWLSVSTDMSVEQIVLEAMVKQGWVK